MTSHALADKAQAAEPSAFKDPRKLPRDLSVFINGPYDSAFRPCFDAIVFTVLCAGLLPRSAMEWHSTKLPRMDRILTSLRGSKYSIHDLSRCQGEGERNLARFNMPFELGIATAESERRTSRAGDHDWLLLVPRDHPYRHFISDLGGHDAEEYEGNEPADIARAILTWFLLRAPSDPAPQPEAVVAALPAFLRRATDLRLRYGDRTPWYLLVQTGFEVAKSEGIIP